MGMIHTLALGASLLGLIGQTFAQLETYEVAAEPLDWQLSLEGTVLPGEPVTVELEPERFRQLGFAQSLATAVEWKRVKP